MFHRHSRSLSRLSKRPEIRLGALFLMLSLSFIACGTRPTQASSQVQDMGCKRYQTVRQCLNKSLCRTVCQAATVGTGQMACSQVCELVPECSDLPVCIEPWPGE